jgi:hypothetical protein
MGLCQSSHGRLAKGLAKGKDIQMLIDCPSQPSPVAAPANIPQGDIWLAKQKSNAPRAYGLDVAHCVRTLMIQSYDELRQVDHRAVSVCGVRAFRSLPPGVLLIALWAAACPPCSDWGYCADQLIPSS